MSCGDYATRYVEAIPWVAAAPGDRPKWPSNPSQNDNIVHFTMVLSPCAAVLSGFVQNMALASS